MTLQVLQPIKSERPLLELGSAWLPASKACECLKYDTDSDLDHLPAASTSLSKGIEMASKPQRIKLWMACFEQSAEECLWSLIWLLWESCVCAVGPGETPWLLPGEDWLASRNLDGWNGEQKSCAAAEYWDKIEVSCPASTFFVLSVEKTDVFLCLEPWLQLAKADGWMLL